MNGHGSGKNGEKVNGLAAEKVNGHADKMNGHIDKIDVRKKMNDHLNMNGKNGDISNGGHDLEVINLKNGLKMDLGTPKIQKVAVKI